MCGWHEGELRLGIVAATRAAPQLCPGSALAELVSRPSVYNYWTHTFDALSQSTTDGSTRIGRRSRQRHTASSPSTTWACRLGLRGIFARAPTAVRFTRTRVSFFLDGDVANETALGSARASSRRSRKLHIEVRRRRTQPPTPWHNSTLGRQPEFASRDPGRCRGSVVSRRLSTSYMSVISAQSDRALCSRNRAPISFCGLPADPFASAPCGLAVRRGASEYAPALVGTSRRHGDVSVTDIEGSTVCGRSGPTRCAPRWWSTTQS